MKKKNGRKYRRRRVFLFLFLLFCMVAAFSLHYTYGRGIVIAIDPGHGGDDVGASGYVDEVDINESTARYLQALLDEDDNYSAVLTREYGEGVTLSSRNRRAEWGLADLFISIHANSSEDGNGHGFECYSATPGSQNYEGSLAFAHLVVDEIAKTGTTIRGEDGVRFLYYDSGGEKIIKESSDETVYEYTTLTVLAEKEIPAILVEQCFVNHTEDIDRLGDEDGCEQAAIAYYRAICAYFSTEPIV